MTDDDLCGACQAGDHMRHVPEFWDESEMFELPCQCPTCTEEP